eukprot:2667818-Lingulodinium_polyedra.AAC.1
MHRARPGDDSDSDASRLNWARVKQRPYRSNWPLAGLWSLTRYMFRAASLPKPLANHGSPVSGCRSGDCVA